jgi:hypothetical protein
MAQGYARTGYPPASSTILPPLQRNRDVGNGSRGYFDQPPEATTPILPSQMVDRFGSVAGPAAFDPDSANTTPQ